MSCMYHIISIPALKDNYIWLLYNNYGQSIVVDPGEAVSVLSYLQKYRLTLTGIFLTHHHHDHVDGVNELVQHFSVPIYGPQEIDIAHKGANIIVAEGDKLKILGLYFQVLSLPGHTLGHIGYYSAPWLFCGDTLFSAGCGRIVEGTPIQMYESLKKINKLPANTQIFGAHEYTLVNINFAAFIFPHDKIIAHYKLKIHDFYKYKHPSLPTMLYIERLINPFLRCDDINLQKILNIYPSKEEYWRIFSLLRKKKDNFTFYAKRGI